MAEADLTDNPDQSSDRSTSAPPRRAAMRYVVGGTFLIRVVNLGLVLLAGLVLARVLGAAGFGAFAYAMSWIEILVIPAQFGFNKLLVRELARARTEQDWGRMRGLVRFSDGLVIGGAIAIAALAIGISYLITGPSDRPLVVCFRLGMVLLPLMALVQLKRAVMEGLHHVRIGQVPEMIVRPALLLIAVLLGAWAMGDAFSSTWAIVLTAAAVAMAAGVAVVMGRRVLPEEARQAFVRYQPRAWLSSALPMMAIGAMTVITNRTDVVMLGMLRGAADAGVYEIPARLAKMVPFALLVITSSAAPEFARLYTQNQREWMQRLLTRAAWGAFAIALPAALVFITFGQPLLTIFGPEFPRGYTALIILTAAQLLNVGVGLGGLALTMSGYEKDAALAISLAVVANIALNLALIPPYGIEGAAVATGSSVILLSIIRLTQIQYRLRLNPTILAWPGRRRPR